MENPNTWNEITKLINETLQKHNEGVLNGNVGLSQAKMVELALKENGYLNYAGSSERVFLEKQADKLLEKLQQIPEGNETERAPLEAYLENVLDEMLALDERNKK